MSNFISGLVVHALETTINILPIGFLCIFGASKMLKVVYYLLEV